MPQQISVYVDWDNDGDFDEAFENITDYVTQAFWRLGMQKAFQSVADTSYAEITLVNSDGRFNPENTSSPYDAGFAAIRPHRKVLIGAYELVVTIIPSVTVTFDNGGWTGYTILNGSEGAGGNPNNCVIGTATPNYNWAIQVDLGAETTLTGVEFDVWVNHGALKTYTVELTGYRDNGTTVTGTYSNSGFSSTDETWQTHTISGAGLPWSNTRYVKIKVTNALLNGIRGDNIKITADITQTAYEEDAMWTGWIESIEPVWEPAGAYTGKTTCKLRCNGPVPLLRSTEVQLEEIYEDTTVDVIIRRILEISNLPASATGNAYWVLGYPGRSELGTSTILGDPDALYSEFDVGLTPINYYWVATDGGRDAYSVINELVNAEQGKFFFDRNGDGVFWNRQHLAIDITNDASVTEGNTYRPVAIDYGYGRYLATVIRLKLRPMKLFTERELVWQMIDPIELKPGEYITFWCYFTREETGERCAIKGSAWVYGITFFGSTRPIDPPEGEDDLWISQNYPKADRMQLHLRNDNPYTVTVYDWGIWGKPIAPLNPIEVYIESSNVNYYGKRGLNIDMGPISNVQDATNMANYILGKRAGAFGHVDWIEYARQADGEDNAHLLNWTMGYRLALSFPGLSHTTGVFIIGEQHTWNPHLHRCRYILEPADGAANVWILGQSELGTDTRLGW